MTRPQPRGGESRPDQESDGADMAKTHSFAVTRPCCRVDRRRSGEGVPGGGERSDAPGDVLTVTRLDRLARSNRDLLNTLAAIIGEEIFPSDIQTYE